MSPLRSAKNRSICPFLTSRILTNWLKADWFSESLDLNQDVIEITAKGMIPMVKKKTNSFVPSLNFFISNLRFCGGARQVVGSKQFSAEILVLCQIMREVPRYNLLGL
jgi:hypothetical protein